MLYWLRYENCKRLEKLQTPYGVCVTCHVSLGGSGQLCNFFLLQPFLKRFFSYASYNRPKSEAPFNLARARSRRGKPIDFYDGLASNPLLRAVNALKKSRKQWFLRIPKPWKKLKKDTSR